MAGDGDSGAGEGATGGGASMADGADGSGEATSGGGDGSGDAGDGGGGVVGGGGGGGESGSGGGESSGGGDCGTKYETTLVTPHQTLFCRARSAQPASLAKPLFSPHSSRLHLPVYGLAFLLPPSKQELPASHGHPVG